MKVNFLFWLFLICGNLFAGISPLSQAADYYYSQHDFSQALELWKLLYKSQPQSVEAVIRVSELQLFLEGHEVAHKTILDFLTEKKRFISASNQLVLQKKLGDLQNCFVKDESQSLYFQSLAKMKLKDFSQSLLLLNQANQIEKGNFRILELKAQCEKELGQYSHYFETLKNAHELGWTNELWNDQLVEAQYHFKDYSDVIAWYQLRSTPDITLRQKVAVGMALIEKAEDQGAVVLFSQVLASSKRREPNPVVWFGLGRAQRKQNNLKSSTQYFQRFLSTVAKLNLPTKEGWDPYRTTEKVEEAKQWLAEMKQGQ